MKPFTVIGLVLGVIALVVLYICFMSWLLMVALGAAGHVFNIDWLFISFKQSIVLAIVLGIIGSFFRSSK